jgi:hypothetical protein
MHARDRCAESHALEQLFERCHSDSCRRAKSSNNARDDLRESQTGLHEVNCCTLRLPVQANDAFSLCVGHCRTCRPRPPGYMPPSSVGSCASLGAAAVRQITVVKFDASTTQGCPAAVTVSLSEVALAVVASADLKVKPAPCTSRRVPPSAEPVEGVTLSITATVSY